MFAFIKIRATRFNIFSSRFQVIFVGFAGLFAFGSRFIWITRIPTRPDPDPTYPDWAPIPNTEQLLPVLNAAGQDARYAKRKANNCYQFNPAGTALLLDTGPCIWVKSEQLFGSYSAQRILLLDPEQKKLQQVLESL